MMQVDDRYEGNLTPEKVRPHPRGAPLMAEKIFTRNFDRADSHTLARYRETGGYTALGQGASAWSRRPSPRR